MDRRGGNNSDAPSLRESSGVAVKPTVAMLRVLGSHALVHPRPVAWTPELCRYETWRRCYEAGLLHGGRLTEAGLKAVPWVSTRKDGSSQNIQEHSS
jgi:hypothetical protein